MLSDGLLKLIKGSIFHKPFLSAGKSPQERAISSHTKCMKSLSRGSDERCDPFTNTGHGYSRANYFSGGDQQYYTVQLEQVDTLEWAMFAPRATHPCGIHLTFRVFPDREIAEDPPCFQISSCHGVNSAMFTSIAHFMVNQQWEFGVICAAWGRCGKCCPGGCSIPK